MTAIHQHKFKILNRVNKGLACKIVVNYGRTSKAFPPVTIGTARLRTARQHRTTWPLPCPIGAF